MTTELKPVGAAWTMSWIGNLVGCFVLALVFVWGGGGAMLHSKSQFIMTAAAAKIKETMAMTGRARQPTTIPSPFGS